MGYLNGLVSANFKTDKNSRVVYFPWGVLGKGHVLPDKFAEIRIRRFLRFYYTTALIVICLSALFSLVWPCLIGIIFAVWFYVEIRHMVSDFPCSDSNITAAEVYTKSAQSHSKGQLLLLLGCCILFTIAGILFANHAKSTGEVVQGIWASAFFGSCGIVILYMLTVK
jgi:hypothetical protein